ncbi:MAG: hypothetical protein V4523_20005 [Pseudomonadota bacterium]
MNGTDGLIRSPPRRIEPVAGEQVVNTTPRARTDIETDAISRPYPGRTKPLPWRREEVTAAWLTETLQNKYHDVVAEHLEHVEFIDSHTAKIRMTVGWNAAGRAAGLPERLCLKSNFLRDYNDVDMGVE